MGKRKRITSRLVGELIKADSLAFTTNNCSQNARMVCTNTESLRFDIWFDKHYYIREQHGDENGKRDGIDPATVRKLIDLSATHLIFYAVKLRKFSFANFDVAHRPERIILTMQCENIPDLNIVTEYHYIDSNRFEVTVKTALRKDDFYFSDGDFQVIIYEDGTSSLFSKERGKVKMIDQYLSPINNLNLNS